MRRLTCKEPEHFPAFGCAGDHSCTGNIVLEVPERRQNQLDARKDVFMAIVLKVDSNLLTETADDMGQRLDVIRSQFDSIEEEVGRMGNYWEGDAYEFHQEQFASLKAMMDETINRLQNHPVNLLQMAGLYTETESSVETVTQSLLADVIV